MTLEVRRKVLMQGVTLTALRTDKFKSSYLSLSLFTPMDKKTVTANALLPAVLRRGTRDYPDNQKISAALDDLCGGTLETRVRQQGETQCIGFVGSFLDDAFSPDGAPILEPAAKLLGDLLLDPVLENGRFCHDYVSGEGKNLADRIRSQINDKRQYSIKRLTELMCADEPYGIDKLGYADQALAITADVLWERYRELLSHAPISIYYCGSSPIERVENALRDALQKLPQHRKCAELVQPCLNDKIDEVRYFEDALDVTQGKLAIGWRTDGINISSPEYPALLVMNAVYGGTTTSKLFMNVREKLSLCYFASSMLEKQKGLMVVSSGIEFEQYQRAKDEILAQFNACAKGEFSTQELEAGRRAVVSSLTSCNDSQGRLEEYWLGQSVAGMSCKPEELADAVEAVTFEQVVRVAERMKLDAVYFLKGKEG